MPLTLDQYATYLDTRGLPWPAAPKADPPKVRAHLPKLLGIRAVLWNVYGTLLAIPEGELKFEVDNALLMNVALDKTIHEFKMWASMSRKPGQPADYMREIYRKALDEQRLVSSPEKHPEILSERIWESIIKKLFQKDYTFDAGFYGSLNDYSRKVAYFFHASLQGTGCYEHVADALRTVADRGIAQGLLADGQCFTSTQLARGLAQQDASIKMDSLIPLAQRSYSFQHARASRPIRSLRRPRNGWPSTASTLARFCTSGPACHGTSLLLKNGACERHCSRAIETHWSRKRNSSRIRSIDRTPC